MSTDAIVKTAVLKAPLARVWAAVSDAREFGQWFGVEFDGPFVAGARLTGRIQPTTVDAGMHLAPPRSVDVDPTRVQRG